MVSVTEIIQKVFRPFEGAGDLTWYMNRGTQVHSCCKAICLNQSFSFDEKISGYVFACKKFLNDFKPVVQIVEKRFNCETLQVTGQPDLIAVIKNESTIIDWKCGLSGYELIQLGGYSCLTGVKFGLSVKLNEDGTYKIGGQGITDISKKWQRYFLGALTSYNCMKELGKI